ncbi:MAG TPA: glucose-6-phosphate dehydrogenase [Candidatus Saccharimonadales bacterium]
MELKVFNQLKEPTIIVIFGVSGDLAKRKVLPALYNLLKNGLLPRDIHIIGTSRKKLSSDDLLDSIDLYGSEDDKASDPEALKNFHSIFEIVKLDPGDHDAYKDLKAKLDDYEEEKGMCFNRLFYLSIPPQVFGTIVKLLGKSGLSGSCKHNNAKSHLLVEKPFGYDLASAKELIDNTAKYFDESQVFRIDHYLAKETAQNILTFRKFNPIFNDVWDNKLISKIHIRAIEKIGIEGRANFYEHVGALRDLVQSHLLQLLALTTMEMPEEITNSEQIHSEKLKLFNSIIPMAEHEVASFSTRGQYEGYKQEVDNPKSTTETYARLELFIDNGRWSGVPMILETGKELTTKSTDITIDFIEPGTITGNKLTIHIQPNEGIDIELYVKQPGLDNRVQTATMEFSYKHTFDDHGQPDAYERVLVDAIRGDQALFASSAEVIRSWEVLGPILKSWQASAEDLKIYPIGSNGPENT